MVIGKIKPTATIVAQFAAGVEIEAIQHEGNMYLPVLSLNEFSAQSDEPTKTEPSAPAGKSKEAKPKASAKAESSEKSSKSYTEDDLMEMSVKELAKICREEFDIDPDDFDGKNTNKKLRNLILDAQENASDADEEVEEDEEDETADDKDENDADDLVDQVSEILEDFDAGKKNKKKTLSAIYKLSDDPDEEQIEKLVKEFETNASADIDDIANDIVGFLTKEKKETKKSPKKTSKKSSEEDLVSPEDLEVGDRVSVWWDDDNQEWFDGEVKSIKKGKIIIAYDDDTDEAIDPEIHTKIKRLAE